MSKFLKVGDKQVEFLEEVKEVLRYNNLVVVLYRKDKELPNNIIFFDLCGNELYKTNDIVQAKIPRGFDYIEKKDDSILIAECEIGIIYEIDLEKKEVLNKEFIC